MLKVMIVDDDKNVCDCLRALIPWDAIGCSLIASACDGREAYNLAIEHAPDVIICDIVMPVMDGTSLCRKIYETMADVTFLFLSAYEDFATAQLALQYHVQDYILKPIDRNKINYIAETLSGIREKREKNGYYLRILHDYDMERAIRQALERKNIVFFEQLFQRITMDVKQSSLDIGAIRSVVYRLMSLLFAWQSKADFAPDADARRAEAFETLDSLKFKMDLIFFASEHYFLYLRPATPSKSAYYESLTGQVTAYIRERFQDPRLSASSVASHFNYSADYLGRLFTQYCGKSVSVYISECRIDRAAALLVEGDLPVGDVMAACGYLSASYFARAFKKHFAMTPSDYRLRYSRRGKGSAE